MMMMKIREENSLWRDFIQIFFSTHEKKENFLTFSTSSSFFSSPTFTFYWNYRFSSFFFIKFSSLSNLLFFSAETKVGKFVWIRKRLSSSGDGLTRSETESTSRKLGNLCAHRRFNRHKRKMRKWTKVAGRRKKKKKLWKRKRWPLCNLISMLDLNLEVKWKLQSRNKVHLMCTTESKVESNR